MKITKIILLFMLSFVVSMSNCKTKSKNTKSEGVTAACRVEVDFASYGSGINNEKFDELIKFLNDNKLKHQVTHRGREGERKVCVPLSELKGNDKATMESQLKKFEDKNTLISVSIN